MHYRSVQTTWHALPLHLPLQNITFPGYLPISVPWYTGLQQNCFDHVPQICYLLEPLLGRIDLACRTSQMPTHLFDLSALTIQQPVQVTLSNTRNETTRARKSNNNKGGILECLTHLKRKKERGRGEHRNAQKPQTRAAGSRTSPAAAAARRISAGFPSPPD